MSGKCLELREVFSFIPGVSVVPGQLLHEVDEDLMMFLQLLQHLSFVNFSARLELVVVDEPPHLSLLVKLQHNLDRVALRQGVGQLC